MEQAILPGMRKEVLRARIRKEMLAYNKTIKYIVDTNQKMQKELEKAQKAINYVMAMLEELND